MTCLLIRRNWGNLAVIHVNFQAYLTAGSADIKLVVPFIGLVPKQRALDVSLTRYIYDYLLRDHESVFVENGLFATLGRGWQCVEAPPMKLR